MNRQLTVPLNDDQWQILSEINGAISQRNIFNSRKADILRRLELLREVRNLRLIRFLLYLTLDSDRDVARTATELLVLQLEGTGFEEIRWIDDCFRKYWYRHDLDERVLRMSAMEIQNSVRTSPQAPYVFCVLAMHESGYLREYALKRLMEYQVPQKIAVIALRCNDWVSQVRAVALTGLKEILSDKTQTEAILDVLPLFSNASEWGRGEGARILMMIRTHLIQPELAEPIIHRFRSTENIRVKRALYEYVLMNSGLGEQAIIEGLTVRDPLILRAALGKLKEVRGGEEISRVWRLLAGNRASMARRDSLAFVDVVMDPENAFDYATKQLCDRTGCVREAARGFLSARGHSDFRMHYETEALINPRVRPHAISGLGEIGAVDSYSFIAGFINDAVPKVRRTALAALVHLDFDAAKETLLDFLCSEREHDSGFARKLLVKSPGRIRTLSNDLAELMELDGFSNETYRNGILLYPYLQKWQALEEYLKVLQKRPELLGLTIAGLERWVARFSRSFECPEPAVLMRIRKLHRISDGLLEEVLASNLNSILQSV